MSSFSFGLRSSQRLPLFANFGLLLLSASALSFEINLIRLFSVSQFYHFAFLIVSLALLGFGASGAYLALVDAQRQKRIACNMHVLALFAAVSTFGVYFLINWLPFDSFSIAWDPQQLMVLALHYVSLSIPFFFTGLAVGSLMSMYQRIAGKVYASNLIGSAFGCLIALIAPVYVGGEGMVVVSVLLASAAALIVGVSQSGAEKSKGLRNTLIKMLAVSIILLGIAGLWQANIGEAMDPIFDMHPSPYKGLSYALQYPDARVFSREWNAFSRVDVVESSSLRSLPGLSYRYPNEPPEQRGLFIDGDNLNPVLGANSDWQFAEYMPLALPFQLRPGSTALFLEPHGGLDVLIGLANGADSLTIVEPNELVIAQTEHILENPKINITVETGRSYLRRTNRSFDVIVISLTDAYHPVRSGAYSLAEDYRYTVEAFQDAMAQLEPNGMLFIARWLQNPPSEWLRTFGTVVTAMEQDGLDPTTRIVAFRGFNLGYLLVKHTPYTDAELEAVREFTSALAFDLVYAPDIHAGETNRFNIMEEPVYYQAFAGLLQANPRGDWYEAYPYDVTPAIDNRPFLGHYFKWSQSAQVLSEFGKTWQPFGGAGYFVLVILLVLALVVASGLILLPVLVARAKSRKQEAQLAGEQAWSTLAYFGFIGLGFLLVEIPLIQQFILFLGHPAYAFTAVLFAVLLFSGLGSTIAHKTNHRKALVVLVILVLASNWALQALFNVALGLPLANRVVVALMALAPLGIMMGIPFPKSILSLSSGRHELVPWAWSINGSFSVIASIVAALIALTFGFRLVLIAGAACYSAARLVSPRLSRN